MIDRKKRTESGKEINYSDWRTYSERFLQCLQALIEHYDISEEEFLYGIDRDAHWLKRIRDRRAIISRRDIREACASWQFNPIYIYEGTGRALINMRLPRVDGMVKALLIFLLAFGSLLPDLPAQTWGDLVVTSTLRFTSGAFRGRSEAGLFHPQAVQRVHPRYQPPDVSWRNKYAGGNPANGPAFWGSTSFFVWLTDDYHRDRMFEHQSRTAAWTYHNYATERPKHRHRNWYETLGGPRTRKPWWAYAGEWAIGFGAEAAGFHATYTYLYK